MKLPSTALCAIARLAIAAPIAVNSPDARAQPASAGFEGMYALEEWHKDGQVLHPPQVDGRFVLLNGSVVYIIHSRVPGATQTTSASFGTYVLRDGKFSYRYDVPSTFTQTASGITVSRDPPWEGMRSFDVLRDRDAVRLRSPNGAQEFVFTKDGLTYSEGGKVLRVWRRVAHQ